MKTIILSVVSVRTETSDAVTISFKQPGLRKIKYIAGQYLTLIFKINGRRFARPYSFSSAPGVDLFLEITVKRIPNGIVSNHICDMVKVGDTIEVIEPMGTFIVEESKLSINNHLVLWGAGSGITPLFSIAKYHLAKANCNVTLVYGNRNHESVLFFDKIHQLELNHPETFNTIHFHTRPTVTHTYPNLIQGRIKASSVLNILSDLPSPDKTLHFICGPAGLKESIREAFQLKGLSNDNVYTEDFELIKNEKDFEDIITRNVFIKLGREITKVEVAKGKSILEAGLDANLEIPYSCQIGNCSVCRGTLISGNVRQTIKRHPDLKENDYQLCCTYPLDDNIEVSI